MFIYVYIHIHIYIYIYIHTCHNYVALFTCSSLSAFSRSAGSVWSASLSRTLARNLPSFESADTMCTYKNRCSVGGKSKRRIRV